MHLSIFASPRKKKRCRHVRVTLNGVDVTNRCQEADTREGWVRLMVLNERGRPQLDINRGEIVRERLHGRVRIARLPARAA